MLATRAVPCVTPSFNLSGTKSSAHPFRWEDASIDGQLDKRGVQVAKWADVAGTSRHGQIALGSTDGVGIRLEINFTISSIFYGNDVLLLKMPP